MQDLDILELELTINYLHPTEKTNYGSIIPFIPFSNKKLLISLTSYFFYFEEVHISENDNSYM